MPILSIDPSSSTRTAADLKAELAAMEEEEAAEAHCKQERVETQGPDEANKKQKSTDKFDRAKELAREGCRRCVAKYF